MAIFFGLSSDGKFATGGCIQSLDWTSRLDWWAGLVDLHA